MRPLSLTAGLSTSLARTSDTRSSAKNVGDLQEQRNFVRLQRDAHRLKLNTTALAPSWKAQPVS